MKPFNYDDILIKRNPFSSPLPPPFLLTLWLVVSIPVHKTHYLVAYTLNRSSLVY